MRSAMGEINGGLSLKERGGASCGCDRKSGVAQMRTNAIGLGRLAGAVSLTNHPATRLAGATPEGDYPSE